MGVSGYTVTPYYTGETVLLGTIDRKGIRKSRVVCASVVVF